VRPTATRPALPEWLASLPWHARYDLTFRVGAEGCEVTRLTAARAERRLRGFAGRLARFYGKRLRVFAAAELQGRGVPHWHVLVRFVDGAPWLRHSDAVWVWQYWRRWKCIPHEQGVEGHVWLVLVRDRSQAMYAAKYAAKSKGEWLMLDVDGRPARSGLRVTVPLDKRQLSLWRQGRAGSVSTGTGENGQRTCSSEVGPARNRPGA